MRLLPTWLSEMSIYNRRGMFGLKNPEFTCEIYIYISHITRRRCKFVLKGAFENKKN